MTEVLEATAVPVYSVVLYICTGKYTPYPVRDDMKNRYAAVALHTRRVRHISFSSMILYLRHRKVVGLDAHLDCNSHRYC